MKKILVLVLTVVMLALLVACNPNVNTDPTAAPNAGTTQGANTPDTGATTPNNEATTSTTATTTTPTQSTTSGIVVTRPEVKLPKASALLAKMIGAWSATLEVSDDASIIYVYEPNYEYEEKFDEEVTGYKSAMFFEVLEASVNSDSENIQAYLKVKVGEAYVELNKLVPAENVVINKNNITSYYEFSITVNGDDVSVKANDENASVNLSELVYGYIAQMVGVEGVEGLETMLENAAILQEIEKDVMILVEKALSNNAEKLPTVSPEYVEHLGNIFTVFGDEIITETKDNATGNTTYSLNLPAAKKLIADLENKTLAGYLEGVYGKNVVGGFASFMATLPDKTVREIVDYAVSLSEGTDVDVKEIYAWIDLYVYSIAGTEIKIEEQISERYNSTLADLLAEFSGVPAEEKAEFIASVKTSFENAAKAIETVSVDELLSSMFMGTNEGFFDAFKEIIDMLDEELELNYTVDAEGVIIAWNYITSAYTYSYAVNGDKVTFTVIMPNDMVFEGTSDSNGASFVVKEGDETVASGNVTVKEETVGEDTTTTVEIDLRDDKNDLLDYTAVYVNGMMTSADVTVRGYDYEYYYVEDPATGETIYKGEEEIFVTIFTVDYDDLGNDGNRITIGSIQNADEFDQITFTAKDSKLTVLVGKDGDTVATFEFSYTDAEGLVIKLDSDKWVLADNDWAKRYCTFNGTIKFKVA